MAGGGTALNLSLLSRGIGEIQQNGHEKVEVFLEPEDYFNFVKDPKRIYLPPIQTRYPFIPSPSTVSASARESKKIDLPKTFTTRRGALLLFSEDLALRNRDRAHKHHVTSLSQSVDATKGLNIKTVDDLAKSILSYGKEQVNESSDVYLGFIHNRRKFHNERQIRPGFSAKRYLSTWTRIWDDALLENVISKGYITERSLFYGSMAAPHLRRRIFHDDLSHYPAPYRLMRNMLISPGSLSGYTFYRMQVQQLDLLDEENDYSSEDDLQRQAKPSIAVVKTKDGVQREVSYASLDRQSQKEVLTDLLVKSAVNFALQKQHEFVENMKNPSPENIQENDQMEAFDMKEAVESLLETEKEYREFDKLTQNASQNLISPHGIQSSWSHDGSSSRVQLPALDRQHLSTIEDVSREGTGMRVLPPIGQGDRVPLLNVAPPTPKDGARDQVTQTSPDEDDEEWGLATTEEAILRKARKESEQNRHLLQQEMEGIKDSSSNIVDGPFQAAKFQFASDTESLSSSRNIPVPRPLQKRQWAGSTHSLKSHSSKLGAGSVIGGGSMRGSLICAPGGEVIRVGGSVALSGSQGDVANLGEVTPRGVPVESKSVYHITDDSDTEEPEAWRSSKSDKKSASLYGYGKSRNITAGDLDASMSLRSFSFSRKGQDDDDFNFSTTGSLINLPLLSLDGGRKSSSSVEDTIKDSNVKEDESDENHWEKITEYPELEGVDTNRSQLVTEDSMTPSPKKAAGKTPEHGPGASASAQPIIEEPEKLSLTPEPKQNSSADKECIQDTRLDNSGSFSDSVFVSDKSNGSTLQTNLKTIQSSPTKLIEQQQPVAKTTKETVPQKIVVIETSFSEAHSSCGYDSNQNGSWSQRDKKYTKKKKKREEKSKNLVPDVKGVEKSPSQSLGLPLLDIRRVSNQDLLTENARLSPLPCNTGRLSARRIVSARKPVESLGQVELTSHGIQEVTDQPKTNRDTSKDGQPLSTRVRKRRKVRHRKIRKKSLPVIERRRPAAKVRTEMASVPTGVGNGFDINNDETHSDNVSSPFWDDSSEYESEYEYYYEDGEIVTDLKELEMEFSRSLSSLDESGISDLQVTGSGVVVPSPPETAKLDTTRSDKSGSFITEIANIQDEESITEQGIVNALTEHAQAIAEHILGEGGGIDLEDDIRKAANLWMQTHPPRKLSRSQSVQEYRAIDTVMKAQRINSAAPTTAEYKEMIKKSITSAVANAAGVDITALTLDADISDELLEALATQHVSPDDVKIVKDPLTGRSQLTTSRTSLKDGHLYMEPNGGNVTDRPAASIPSERASVKDIGEVDVISYMASETIELADTVKSDKSDTKSIASRSKVSSASSEQDIKSVKSVTEEHVLQEQQVEEREPEQVPDTEVEQPSPEVKPTVSEAEKEEETSQIKSKPTSPEEEKKVNTSDHGSAKSRKSSESIKSQDKNKTKPVKLEEREEFVVGKVKEEKENEKLYGRTEPPQRKPSLPKVPRRPTVENAPPPKLTTEPLSVPEQKEEKAPEIIERVPEPEKKSQPPVPEKSEEEPVKPIPKDTKYQSKPKEDPVPKKVPQKEKEVKKKEEPAKKQKPFIPPPGARKEKPKPAPPAKPAPVPETKPDPEPPGKPKEKKAKAPPPPPPKKEEKKKKGKKTKKSKKVEEVSSVSTPVAAPVPEAKPSPVKEPTAAPAPPKSITPRVDSGVRSDSRSFATPESDGMEFIIIRDRSPTPEPEPEPEKVPSPLKPDVSAEPEPADEKEDSDDENKLNLISNKDARAAKRAAAAAKRREEVERKRKEREEEAKREREKQERDRQRELEAEDARRRQEEQRRLRKQQEESDRLREELESREREKRRLQEIERDKRLKEERQRKFEEMRRRQLEEEQKRLEQLLLRQAEEEELYRLEEEKKSKMEEEERIEYERRMKEEEELRKQREALEKQRREEEAARLIEEERQKAIAEARKRAELEARLKFTRSLQLESQGLSEHSHQISEAFVFSYYEILQWLGLDIPEFELQKLEQM